MGIDAPAAPAGAIQDLSIRVGTPEDALCIGVLGMQVFLDTYATDGIRLTFGDPGEHEGTGTGTGTKAYRDPDLRISGRARVRTFVTG